VLGLSHDATSPATRQPLRAVHLRLERHDLVGVGAAAVTSADALVVRELGGLRWHRCLRCDVWVPSEPPVHPVLDTVPPRDRIEVPLRGPALRDRYVLRAIAIDRTIHVIVLTALAVVIFLFLGHRHALQSDYDRIMSAPDRQSREPERAPRIPGPLQALVLRRPVPSLRNRPRRRRLRRAGGHRGGGLWYARRWAEYLTFVATIVFIPLEIDELTRSVTTLKVLTLVLNLAIALYLLLAKRLFGLRAATGP